MLVNRFFQISASAVKELLQVKIASQSSQSYHVSSVRFSKESKRIIPFSSLLDEKDIKETFCRGGGPGGQSVNKSMNKVRLTHIPTGISVACHEQRDLTTNRSLARKLLRERLDLQFNGKESKLAQRAQKAIKRKKNYTRYLKSILSSNKF